MFYIMSLILTVFLWFGYAKADKYYVVERSRGALGVIDHMEYKKDIKDLGDMNHAIVKYGKCYAYVISRNGILSKIDPKTDTLIKQVKAGESSIDFDISKHLIAVSNYAPKTVVFFNHNFKLLKSIYTGSRNVGIKFYEHYTLVLLMDKNAIWIIDNNNFKVVKKIKNVGIMPFDAIRDGNTYIVSFFVGDDLGILKFPDMKYKVIHYGTKSNAVLKIPHYGLFSMWHHMAFIPPVGERAVNVIDIRTEKLITKIPLIGYPVFIIVSPKENLIAVNYSGDKDDYISFINPYTMKLIKTLKVGRRIMHMRFSKDGTKILISDYFDDEVKVLDTNNFKLSKAINFPQPSGIFRLPSRFKKCKRR